MGQSLTAAVTAILLVSATLRADDNLKLADTTERPTGNQGKAADLDGQPAARRSTWAEYWAGWGRTLRVYGNIYWDILQAPKLGYRVDALEVYPNGVYAEFGVTNPGRSPIHLAVERLEAPVRRMSMTDSRGRKWQVPRFRGSVLWGNPDDLVSVPAGGTVWYRYRLSFIEDKPLELVAPPKGKADDRPTELAYFVAGWHRTYPRLKERGQESIAVYAIGTGRVPVKWFDKPYPKEWPVQSRYFGPRAGK
jgi:hypothetical protein